MWGYFGPCATCVLMVLQITEARVICKSDVFLPEQPATSFLSRTLLYNSWDFELVVPGNIERECMEEVCTYEEAREVFKDKATTDAFWDKYTHQQAYAPKMDMSGMVAGIVAAVVILIFVAILICYCCRRKNKNVRGGQSVPVTMPADVVMPPESVPLAGVGVPGLPSYNEAISRTGQHDLPPPPYLGDGEQGEPTPPDTENI
ncbi:transmembrane gamma-carboxyglutamic acid protein 2 [Paramormyrops kingsleyae]|uniref:Proline rich and Gla domain 2 n=1 Tax=Paramormyrops kingsleyae TaxID=1676925 RepID=A0A3B3RU59_9TELE|nr:transmembrane gamma-carboxyglutamic acid protein 2 [Paramormyrops kingsleyae]